jgi:hypothetical protein
MGEATPLANNGLANMIFFYAQVMNKSTAWLKKVW